MSVKFSGNYFKENKSVYPLKSVMNIYIVYELEKRTINSPDFTAQNCLFGTVKIIQDSSDSSNNKYIGYGLCFDAKSDFSNLNITHGKNVIILVSDLSSSVHANNKKIIYMF